MALKNNGDILVAEKEVEKAVLQKKASFNPGKTDVDIEYGQYNSFYNDLSLTVSQPFEFPTTYIRQKQLAEEQIKLKEYDLKIRKALLKRAVYDAWNNYSMLLAQYELLEELDSAYKNFEKTAQIRYKVQDASYLEKVSAETKSKAINNKYLNLRAELNIAKAKLKQLLNDTTDYTFQPTQFSVLDSEEDFTEQAIENHPAIQQMKQQISIALQEKKLAKSKLLPDFSVGFFSLTMQENPLQNGDIAGTSDRFNGFVAKVSVPLFYGSYKNKIKQMSISQAQSEIKYEYAKNQLSLQFEQLLQNYLIKKNNLSFYQNTALKQAEEIRKTAVSTYNSQAIGYIELIQLLEQSYQIKQEYLQALQAYNNCIIELNYLLNK